MRPHSSDGAVDQTTIWSASRTVEVRWKSELSSPLHDSAQAVEMRSSVWVSTAERNGRGSECAVADDGRGNWRRAAFVRRRE